MRNGKNVDNSRTFFTDIVEFAVKLEYYMCINIHQRNGGYHGLFME